jgi:hypothetical protein
MHTTEKKLGLAESKVTSKSIKFDILHRNFTYVDG